MVKRLRDLLVRFLPMLQVTAVAVVAAAYLLGGSEVGKRTLGICIIVGALLQQGIGRIPYGWEGRDPSGYLTGWKALLFNLALGAVGAYFAFFPRGLDG
jgi:hypothetical protein